MSKKDRVRIIVKGLDTSKIGNKKSKPETRGDYLDIDTGTYVPAGSGLSIEELRERSFRRTAELCNY